MFRKYLILLLITVFLPVAIPPLSAQDAVYKCDLPTMAGEVDALIGALTKLKSSGETDPVKIADVIEQVAVTANILRGSCDNLVFKDKKQTVIGPVEVPKGLYRVKLETKSKGYIGVTMTVADGECGAGSYGNDTLLFNTSGDEFGGEGETIFKSNGCTILVEVKIEGSPWTVTFERLSTS